MIEGRSFDMLGGVDNAQTPLFLTLIGFRKSVMQHLGVTDLPLIPNENKKLEMRRSSNPSYPYGYMALRSMEVVRDQQPSKAIQKYSSSGTLDRITNAMVSKGFLFPAKLSVELHYLDNDFKRIVNIVEKLCIFGAIDALSFEISMPEGPHWVVEVRLNEGPVDIPESMIDNPAEPDAWDVQTVFELHTRVGVVKSVPKVNNEGEVTKSYVIEPAFGRKEHE
jgi:hypothetical protein